MSSTTCCKHCGCCDIDDDPSRGNKVCMGCGSVLEESAIVSEVGYVEGAGGSSSMVGQIVSGTGTVRVMANGYAGQERESREITLQKGRMRIQEVAGLLKLNNHCRDTAFTFFKMAVSKGLTRGRPRNHVVAACLYTTCRLEGTPHLLLDFSDVLSVNVYELGKVFSFFCRALYINVPPTDPCLYILRFANVLRFGDKENQVASLALRIVTRMKRDWIVIGRRPTGICGAALIVAARYFNFNRTIQDMVKVVNIGEGVLRKRMQEFSVTPSANLTLEEFNSVDLEEEADPPAYREAKEKPESSLPSSPCSSSPSWKRPKSEKFWKRNGGGGFIKSQQQKIVDRIRQGGYETPPFCEVDVVQDQSPIFRDFKKRQEMEKAADLLTSEFKTQYEEVEREIDKKSTSKRGRYSKDRQKFVGFDAANNQSDNKSSSELIDVSGGSMFGGHEDGDGFGEEDDLNNIQSVPSPVTCENGEDPTGKSSNVIGLDEFLSEEVMEIAGIKDTAEKLRAIANKSDKTMVDKYERFAPNLKNLGLVGPPSPIQYADGSVSGAATGQEEKSVIGECSTNDFNNGADQREQIPDTTNENGELELDDISDSELEGYILNEPEVRMKTFLWMKQNGDFMRQLEERRRIKAEEEEMLKKDPNRKKWKKRQSREPIQGKTAAEAMEKVLQEKRLSSKINYSVLVGLDPTAKTNSDTNTTSSTGAVNKVDLDLSSTNPFDDVRKSDIMEINSPSTAGASSNLSRIRAKRKVTKPNIGGPASKKFTVPSINS